MTDVIKKVITANNTRNGRAMVIVSPTRGEKDVLTSPDGISAPTSEPVSITGTESKYTDRFK